MKKIINYNFIEHYIIFDNQNKKDIILLVLRYIFMFTIIISFCLLLPVFRNNEICIYENSTYDYWAQCLTKSQVKEIADKDFVDKIFAFSLVGAPYAQVDDKNKETDLMMVVTKELESLDISSFPAKNCISRNNRILHNKKTNPIIIDYSLAKSLGVSVGDKISIPFGKDSNLIQFTIGAIYQKHSLFSRFDVVILMDNEQEQYLEAENEDIGYSMAYIKAKKINKLEKYMEEDFFPNLVYKKKEMFSQDINNVNNDDLYKNYDTTPFYDSREKQLQDQVSSLKYTPRVIFATTFLGCIIFMIILYREQSKKMENIMFSISVLYSLGLTKRKIQLCYIKSFILFVIPALITALLLEKYVVYKYFTEDLFIPWYLLINYGILLILIILIVILITSVLLVKKISTEKIQYYFNKDE